MPQHPLHIGRTGAFEYLPGLWGGYLNPPASCHPTGPQIERGRPDAAPPFAVSSTSAPPRHAIRQSRGDRHVTRFILRRLLVTIPVLFGIVFLVFALARMVPGDPCRAVLGERATDAICDEFILRYGLDQPIPPVSSPARGAPPAESRPRSYIQFAPYLGSSRPATSGLHQALATGDGAAHRAAADDRRADALGDALRHRPRHPPRPHLGLSPQLPDRCRHDGLRQPRRLRCPCSCSASSWPSCSRSSSRTRRCRCRRPAA